jgi:hypothetical protein
MSKMQRQSLPPGPGGGDGAWFLMNVLYDASEPHWFMLQALRFQHFPCDGMNATQSQDESSSQRVLHWSVDSPEGAEASLSISIAP